MRFLSIVLTLLVLATGLRPAAAADPIKAGEEFAFSYGFAVAWSDARQRAVLSEVFALPVKAGDDPYAAGERHRRLQQAWGDQLADKRWTQSEIVGWFDSRAAAEKQRAQRLGFLRERLRYAVEERYAGLASNVPPAAGEAPPTFRHTIDFSLTQDGLHISGQLTCRAQFVFFGYPYLKAEYGPVVIEDVYWQDFSRDRLSRDEIREAIPLPVVIESGGQHLEVTFNVVTPAPSILNDVEREMGLVTDPVAQWTDRRAFTFPVERLTPVTDSYDNEAVDAFFRELELANVHDSAVWEASWLNKIVPFELEHISENIVRDLVARMDAYAKQGQQP